MKLGARILKTGITLVLAIYISEFLDLGPTIYAAIAATLAIQPSVYRSWQYGVEQIQSNVVGATIAIIFSTYLGTHPILTAIAVMLVIGINLRFHFERSIPLSIVTVLSIMEGGAQESEFLLFALDRFLLILVGLLSAILVNALLFPPKYDKQLTSKINYIEDNIASILRIILDDNKNQSFIRNNIKELEQELKESGELLKFEEEAKSYFRKRLPFSSSRKLVVYKEMLETSAAGIRMFHIIEKYQNTIMSMPPNIQSQLKVHLVNLANYQDRIYSKYEGKINSTDIFQQDKTLFEDSWEIYLSLNNTLKESDVLFQTVTVLAAVNEYHKSLDFLDKVVNNYHSHHKAK